MHRLCIVLTLLVSFLAAAASHLAAQPAGKAAADRWVRIGEIELDRLATRDAIDIDQPAAVFKAVRLEAKKGDVVFSRVQVLWQDSAVHLEDRTIDLKVGERTRPIGAADTPRRLARVGVVYRAGASPQPAANPVVEVWGLQSGAAAQPSTATADGVLLASHPISFASGRDVVRIDPDAGLFRRIGLRLAENDVFVEEVRVVYTDVEPEVVRIGSNLPIDSPVHWLDLERGRPIKEIEVVYKARPAFKGKARLEIYGEVGRDEALLRRLTQEKSDLPAAPRRTRAVSAQRTASPSDVSGTPCIGDAVCTPVPVFFGTNRARKDDGGNILFSQDRGEAAILGQATVTVPRAYRKKGEIPRPSWWDLARLSNPFSEDPARHFTILRGATRVYASEAEFLAAVTAAMVGPGVFKDHAFVFVHGYNVSFDNALYRTAQIAYDLGQDDMPFGTAFLYSWPSAGEFESYVYDLESAGKAVPHLEAFIDLVVSRTGARNVHLIAHSMGNGPLLAALSNMAAKSGTRTNINQVILAAPDVDAGDFAALSAKILPIAGTLTLYASSQDRAIQASRKIRRDLPRAGDVINGLPVIVAGLDTVDVSTVSTGILSLNHAAYADKKELLNDMRRLMLTGQRPPDFRDISIRKVTDRSGTFWRFVK